VAGPGIEQIVDLEDLATRTGGDTELESELFHDFLSRVEGWMAAMVTAFERGERGTVGRTAHRLRGALGALGATRACHAAWELEVAATQEAALEPGAAAAAEAEMGAALGRVAREVGRASETMRLLAGRAT